MKLLPGPWVWLVTASLITSGKADEKTGAPDDWGRGHLFRSGRSYNPISKRYLIKEMSSYENFDRNSVAKRKIERNLYNKNRIFEKDRGINSQILMKRLFGGKHMMRSAKRKGLAMSWQ